jgi:hypothetical protein
MDYHVNKDIHQTEHRKDRDSGVKENKSDICRIHTKKV